MGGQCYEYNGDSTHLVSGCGLNLSGTGYGPTAASSVDNNEASVSIKDVKYLRIVV
jgi:hypothetical protein